jgi:hypothetical protein
MNNMNKENLCPSCAGCNENGELSFLVLQESLEELYELFDEHFMKEFTNFNNFEEFTFSGAVFVNWQTPEIMSARKNFDYCVIGKTKFDTWNEMYLKAKQQKK